MAITVGGPRPMMGFVNVNRGGREGTRKKGKGGGTPRMRLKAPKRSK